VRYPDRVRALALLEPDATRELAPATAAWVDDLAERLRQCAASDGIAAVGEALITEVAGEGAWRSFPDELRRIVTENGPAILAELSGEWWLPADAGDLATLRQPTLLVAAADSSPELRRPTEALATRCPTHASSWSGGGHLIDPAHPVVLEFVEQIVA
jgi:pimeloyl-ACP methyl ester carboxylesterase